jgi:hypothetical protein
MYPNGVLSTGSKTNNKALSLYEAGTVSDNPSTTTNFSGFGVNANTLRYQVPLTTDTHRFFNGSTESFNINGSVIGCAPNFTLDRSQLSGEARTAASNTATTGTSSYIFKTNNGTQTSKLYMDQTGLVEFDNGLITAFEVYSNGVLTAGKRVQKKVFALYDMGASDTPASATNFYGMGINNDTFRFQVPTTATSFKFFSGSTLGFTITGAGGTPVSDIRLEREIEDYDNALDQVCKIRAKKFKLLDIEENK